MWGVVLALVHHLRIRGVVKGVGCRVQGVVCRV